MELKLHTESINGIELSFLDSPTSLTVPEVFKELRNDIYGVDDAELTPDDYVIDVGANVGMFSIYVNKKFGCKIIAFEPVKESYDNFKRNILLNGCNNDDFEVYNFAVTDKDGDTVTIGIQEWNLGGSSIYYKNPIRNSTAQTVTLSKYINDNCKFLKLDCEGSEHVIIPSIVDKINIFKYIGIEYHKIEGVAEPLDLIKFLGEHYKGNISPQNNLGFVTIGSHFL